jgi:hypothetical protein
MVRLTGPSQTTPSAPAAQAGIDAESYPIIWLHYGAQGVEGVVRQRRVERLHRLGPRAVFELLAELDAEHGLGADLDDRLDAYARLSPEIVRAVGGGGFAPSVHLAAAGEST